MHREYPGAPDRGGKPDDTENLVKLFAAIRSEFNAAPRDYELTFTIPASYWYLRWFDMPGLMEYSDWTNLVRYPNPTKPLLHWEDLLSTDASPR